MCLDLWVGCTHGNVCLQMVQAVSIHTEDHQSVHTAEEPKGGHLEEPVLGQGVDETFPFSQSPVASFVRRTTLFH